MNRKTDIKTCRYGQCNHPDKKIDITLDDYRLVGKSMYYHTDCYQRKKRESWKDDKTKSDLQYIKNQWVLHINKTVVYSQLMMVLNDFLSRGVESEYLVFVMDYVVSHKMKLNYPMGLKYYVDKQEIKNAYIKSKAKKIDETAFSVEQSDHDIPEEPRKTPTVRKPKGFESILKRKNEVE